MHTDILTPKDLFQKEVRYAIPPFQRPYVWSQDDQREPLWEDVRNVAENYLEELERSDDNGAIELDEAIAAVIDYFAERITRDQAIALVRVTLLTDSIGRSTQARLRSTATLPVNTRPSRRWSRRPSPRRCGQSRH